MSRRRKLDREGLEIYLLNLLLAYRPLLFVCGIFLLFYAIGLLISSPLAGLAAFLPPMFLLLLCYSYSLTFNTARLGAWLISMFQRQD